MNKTAQCVLRVGLGITFFWIGVLILQAPDSWAALLQPWAKSLIPGSWLILSLQSTAVLDMAVGACLISGVFMPLATLVGAVHILTVLVTVGINEVTVRDIGLLGATTGLYIESAASLMKRGAWMEFFSPKS
jgi:hypothetical protein